MVCIHFPLGLDVRTSDNEDWTFEVHPISSSCIHKEMYYQIIFTKINSFSWDLYSKEKTQFLCPLTVSKSP